MPTVPRLSIIVPTFNERANVSVLLDKLAAALAGVAWEVIYVDDDSPDGTADVVRGLAQNDPRVRCLRRIGRRGLAGACIEGMLASSAPVLAVMDADLQHDETLLPAMLKEIDAGADLVVGSRYLGGGASGTGFSKSRQGISNAATVLAQRLLGVKITDPMSGFFMVRREVVEEAAPRLSEQGFKILLDLIASTPRKLRTVELPFTFRERHAGVSKLDSLVAVEFAGLVLSKLFGDWLSMRFILFAMVGFSGLAVHLILLQSLLKTNSVAFSTAQVAATYGAMIWNFFINNQLTYRDRRLRGWGALRGLLIFCLVCSVGAIANVGVASWIFYGNRTNVLLAGTAGALMGAVFNYAASSVLTWRKR